MKFFIDHRERAPIYRQLVDQVRYAISVGRLKPGDALPSIRHLEAELGVNRNTIRRAYLDLAAEGLLEIRHGREAAVAARALQRPALDSLALTEVGADLATLLIHRSESEGLDALHLAEHLAVIAREHDAEHPKFAFLECSRRQALYFAARTEEVFSRRCVGLDLHDLHHDESLLPGSVRYVLTPHWHMAEAQALLRNSDAEVFAISVGISPACATRLRAWPAGPVGLVVRDVESGPGFSAVVQEILPGREVRVFLLHQVERSDAAFDGLAGVVMTSPCVDIVQAAAPKHAVLQELIFEPAEEELRALRARLFPPLTRSVTGAGRR